MLQPFKIVDKKTGKVLTVYGDTAPTEQDQAELFDAYEKGTWKPGRPPKPFTITDEKNKLSLTVYGDEAPTEEDKKELFSAYRKGTWRPAARPVYRTEEELTAAVKNREEQGEAPEDVKTFVEQALKDRESERTRELKSMFAAQTSSPFGAMGLANMDPALRREMLEAQAKPTPAAISEIPVSGQIGDIGMKVVVPLAVGIATRNPLAMAAAGAGVDMLVQQREEMRGEPVKSAPVRGTRVLTESVLTAINPPALKAGTGVAQGALIRGTQTGAMVGAGELAQQVVGQATGQDVVDIGEVFDVATLGAAFGGAFGALETTAPAVWAKIKDLKPLRALRVLLGEPKTPEIEKAIEGLQQVVHQNFPGDQILVQKRADLRREALQQRAREAGEEVGPVPSEEVAKAFEPFEGVVPPSPAEESARAFQEDVGLAKLDAERIMAEGMAPRPVNPAAAIEEAVGISQTAEQPKGYSPAAPGTEGPVAPSQQTELAREARRADATQAFENLPVATRAEESARILEEAAMQQDRAIVNLAGRMEENFFQGRLGSEETSPTPDMDRVRKADQRLAELERRPGGAAKETARVEAQKAEAMKDVAAATAAQRAVREETEKAAGAVPTPPPTPEPELSPQAQRMVDRFAGADRQLLMGLAGGGTGFVVGWNTGEGLPPDQRLARALASGVGGAFTPTAIRRIIGMQGWANRVIKERGIGSSALNTADPQILAALSVKGAALVGEGVKNFAEWGDKMVREFGDSIRPKLKEIWAAGQESDIIPNKVVDKAPERPPRTGAIKLASRPEGKQEAADLIGDFAQQNNLTHAGGGVWLGDKAQLELKPGFGREWSLSFIGTQPGDRGKGYASNLLSRITAFADKNNLPITLTVNPVRGEGKKGLDAKQLTSWYERYGFELNQGSTNRMTRPPTAAEAPKTPQSPAQSYETPNFKAWFKNSQVVNEDGTPRRMYHGTTKNNLTKFDQRSGGIWVAFDPAAASPGTGEEAGSVIPLFVSAQKIYKLSPDEFENWRMSKQPKRLAMDILNRERGNGYDAVQIEDYALVVAKPTQVKSAVSNSGAYSDRDPRFSGFSTPAAMVPVAGAGAGAVIGASQGETAEEKLRYAALGAAAGAGAGAALVRGARGMVGKGVKTAAAIPTAAEAPKMDPRIARFITKQLAIPLGSFAGGFTYGFLEAAELPPDKRLINGLQWAAIAGGIGYAVANRSIKAIKEEIVTSSTAKKIAPDAMTGEEVLAKVRKTFTPDPTELTKEQEMLTTPQAKLLQSFQNVFRPLSQMEKALVGTGENILLGDAASMVAGSVGKAEAAVYLVDQAQKDLIPEMPKEVVNEYLFLRRVADRLTDNPATGKLAEDRKVGTYTREQARIGLDALRKQVGDDNFVKLEEFARVVQTSADEDLKLLIRSGRMSEQDYAAIKADNEFYAPFYVMEYFSQMDGTIESMGGKALDTTQSVVKAIKGIKDEDFKLLDIMTGFRINKMRAQVLADKNNVMRRMAELSRVDTEHRFMKDLGTKVEAKYSGEVPKGWELVNYMENGVQKKIAVLPEVAQAVKGMDTIRAGAFMTTLASFASPLRAGATGLNAGFQIVNIFKDAARLGIMSKYGIEKNPVDLFMFIGDLMVGFTHSVRSNLLGDKSQLYLDFLKSGAARSTLASSLVPDALARAAQQGDDKLAASILKVPLRSFISGTEKFGNALEESIKLAGFRRGVRAEGLGKLTGKAYDDALERIAYEVRNYAGSPDFSKHGTHGKALNVLFMFANARIQGTAADLRRIVGRTGDKERNAAVVRLAAGIGTATGYLWYLNNQPENVEDYNKRSLSERNAYFLWPRTTETGDPMYYINEEGQKVREYLRFPKFEVVGMVANVFEAGLNYAAKRDPKGIAEMGKVALENLSPIPITGRNFTERIQSVASGLNPVFKAPLEIATNKSFFQHRDIVKQRLQGVRPEEQYLETTPKAFIDVARAMPEMAPDVLRSPLYLKQLTENFTGSMLTQFMRPQLEGRSNATTNPLVARFFAAPIVDEQETWDQINNLKTEQGTKNLLRERAIDQYIKDSAGYTPAQRMQSLSQLLASDPERNAAAMYRALLDRNRGITDTDRAVRSLEPQFRAQFIEEKVRKMETKEQRDMFYREMINKGIINEKTGEEILKLRAAPEGKKTSMKEGKLYRDPTTGVMKIYRNGAFV